MIELEENKRKRILDAASELFQRHGLKKTTIEEIAKEARIGKGTIYLYFQNKEEIFLKIGQEKVSATMKKLRAAINSETDPNQQLRQYLQTRLALSLEFFKENPMNIELLVESKSQSEYRQIREKMHGEDSAIIREVLEKGQRENLFDIENLDNVLWIIGSVMHGIMASLFIGSDAKCLAERMDFFAVTLLNGIKKRIPQSIGG